MYEPDPALVLVVGSGGREHALAKLIAQSSTVSKVYVAPGNGGTAFEDKVENVGIGAGETTMLLNFARDYGVGLTVVGPEAPLALGVTDEFRAEGLPIFGPSGPAARLESSKVWAREFMARQGIPHPQFRVAEDARSARGAVAEMEGRCVVKADGLAAGKGVIIVNTLEEGDAAVDRIMVERAFGDAGDRVLVEELAEGPELSIMAVTDGYGYVIFPPAQDYKRQLDGDRGPNTGGMGSYTPAPDATPEIVEEVRRRVIAPTLEGMLAEGMVYSGCLYCGMMLTESGPVVLEYNVRFGDPETQAQLPLVREDLAAILRDAARGSLGAVSTIEAEGRSAVCVVLAAEGYPEAPKVGEEVRGLDTVSGDGDVTVFHAGTRREGDQVFTSGGRSLNVVCVGDSLSDAISGAYAAIGTDGVHFDKMQYRTDIGARAVQ
jgi:phosphoribosylamine--glycine ligase